MDTEQQVNQEEVIMEQPQVMDRETAIQQVLKISLCHGGVLKGIAETVKALEQGKAKVVFLADDCDKDDYKNLIKALCSQNKVPVVEIPEWVSLKDFCKLGMNSETIKQIAEEKGKDAKIKPRCSSAVIVEWGEDSEAKTWLESNAM